MDPHLFVSPPPDQLYRHGSQQQQQQQQQYHPSSSSSSLPSFPATAFYNFDSSSPLPLPHSSRIPPPNAAFWAPNQGFSSAYVAPEVFVPAYHSAPPSTQPPPPSYGWSSEPYQERWIQSWDHNQSAFERPYPSGTPMPAPKRLSKKKKKKVDRIEVSTGKPTTTLEVNTAKPIMTQGTLFSKMATAEKDASRLAATKTLEKEPVWCSLCQIPCTSHKVLKRHLIGKKHRYRLKNHKTAIEVTEPTTDTEIFPGGILTGPTADNEKTFEVVVPMPDNEKSCGVAVPITPKEKSIVVTAKDVFEQMWLELSMQGKGSKPVISKAEAGMEGAYNEVEGATATALLSDDGKKRARGEMEMMDRPNSAAFNGLDVAAPSEGGTKEQDQIRCKLCNVECNSRIVLEMHYAGKKHAARLRRSLT